MSWFFGEPNPISGLPPSHASLFICLIRWRVVREASVQGSSALMAHRLADPRWTTW